MAKVRGYVFSRLGEPLAEANVLVLGTGVGAACDAAGYFEIENLFAGEYDIEAQFLGYRSSRQRGVLVQKDFVTTVNFRLEPAVVPLPDVVVESPRVPGHDDLFSQVFTRDVLDKSTSASVGEFLVHAAGIDVIEEGGGSTRKRVSIRGSNPNQVLVLLDGVELNDPLTGESDLNQIPLSMVEEIRISKGGGSQRFGSGALAGVVEIISRSHSLDEIRVSATVGNYDAFGVRPLISGRVQKIDYFLTYERRTEAGDYPYSYKRIDGTTVRAQRLNANFSSNNYFASLGVEHGSHSVRLQANLFNADRGLPGLVFAWTPYANADSERRILVGRYAFHRGNLSTSARLFSHFNGTEFANAPPDDAPLKYKTVPSYHNSYRITTSGAMWEATLETAVGHTFHVRTNVQWDDFSDKDLLSGGSGPVRNTNNRNAGVQLGAEWQLPKPAFLTSFFLTQALRFDNFSIDNQDGQRDEQEFSPQVGLRLSHRDAWLFTLQTSVGRAFRVPTFADLFYQDFRVRGNATLQPETSTDLEVGLRTGVPAFGWLELSGTYFHNEVKNLIVWQLGAFATWQPSNTDARLQGLEVNATWRLLGDHLQMSFNHTYVDAVDRSGRRTTHNKQLTYRPEHTSKIGLIVDLQAFSLDYHKRVVGERFATASNTIRLPQYTVDDVTLTARKNLGDVQVSLKLSVLNLSDENYEIVRRAPMPGRNWRAGIELAY